MSQKMKVKSIPPQDSSLKAIVDFWPCLRFWQRKSIVIHACWLVIPRLHSPVGFSLRAVLAIFTLLIILPQVPLSMPAAAGGGLAFALLTQ